MGLLDIFSGSYVRPQGTQFVTQAQRRFDDWNKYQTNRDVVLRTAQGRGRLTQEQAIQALRDGSYLYDGTERKFFQPLDLTEYAKNTGHCAKIDQNTGSRYWRMTKTFIMFHDYMVLWLGDVQKWEALARWQRITLENWGNNYFLDDAGIFKLYPGNVVLSHRYGVAYHQNDFPDFLRISAGFPVLRRRLRLSETSYHWSKLRDSNIYNTAFNVQTILECVNSLYETPDAPRGSDLAKYRETTLYRLELMLFNVMWERWEEMEIERHEYDQKAQEKAAFVPAGRELTLDQLTSGGNIGIVGEGGQSAPSAEPSPRRSYRGII